MSDTALLQLFDYIKSEIVKGGNWRERVTNSAKYKILDSQYEDVAILLDKAEEFMKSAESLKYFMDKEITYMIESRKRMNKGVKVPFFDELDKEILRLKRILTFQNINNYDINSDYIDTMIRNKLLKEASKHGFTFRDEAILQRLRENNSGV